MVQRYENFCVVMITYHIQTDIFICPDPSVPLIENCIVGSVYVPAAIRLLHETEPVVLYGPFEHLHCCGTLGRFGSLDHQSCELHVTLEDSQPLVDIFVEQFEQIVSIEITPPFDWFLKSIVVVNCS